MDGDITKRKAEHIETLLTDEYADRSKHYFDRINLIHRALPEIAFGKVDTSVEFLGKRLSFPFLISSMTGGAGDELRQVNRNLALAAERLGVAMGVGSQRVMFSEPAARGSFELREFAPNAVICANLGAVQLNEGFGEDECRAAVDILEADALILHLNPLQEICQIEGNTDFRGLADRIAGIVDALKVPIIVKEVGAGISAADAELLIQAGVRYIDVAGSGGVSWSRVETRRARKKKKVTHAFDDWGIPTPDALKMMQPYLNRVNLIASGGIRGGIDMVKALILGAHICGMARPLLDPALESEEAVIEMIRVFNDEFRRAMFLLGCPNVSRLRNRDDLIL